MKTNQNQVVQKLAKKGILMSKQYPECPLYNHITCRDLHNPKLCAIIREDKHCFKKKQKQSKIIPSNNNLNHNEVNKPQERELDDKSN